MPQFVYNYPNPSECASRVSSNLKIAAEEWNNVTNCCGHVSHPDKIRQGTIFGQYRVMPLVIVSLCDSRCVPCATYTSDVPIPSYQALASQSITMPKTRQGLHYGPWTLVVTSFQPIIFGP